MSVILTWYFFKLVNEACGKCPCTQMKRVVNALVHKWSVWLMPLHTNEACGKCPCTQMNMPHVWRHDVTFDHHQSGILASGRFYALRSVFVCTESGIRSVILDIRPNNLQLNDVLKKKHTHLR